MDIETPSFTLVKGKKMFSYGILLLVFVAVTGEQYRYTIKVKTADDGGAGTNGDVRITLFGTESKTHLQNLDTRGDDFERGSLGTYTMDTQNQLGDLRCIRVNFDYKFAFDNWKMQYIEVQGPGTSVRFNYNQWFTEDKTIDLFNGDEGCKDSSCDCLREARNGSFCSRESDKTRCKWSCYECRTKPTSVPTTNAVGASRTSTLRENPTSHMTSTITTTIEDMTSRVTSPSFADTTDRYSTTVTIHRSSQHISLQSTSKEPETQRSLESTAVDTSVVTTATMNYNHAKSSSQRESETGSTIGIAVGGSLALILIVAAVVLVACVIKRRQFSKRKENQASLQMNNLTYNPCSPQTTSENGKSPSEQLPQETTYEIGGEILPHSTDISDLYSKPIKQRTNGTCGQNLHGPKNLDDLYSKPVKPMRNMGTEPHGSSDVSDLYSVPSKGKLNVKAHGHDNPGYCSEYDDDVEIVTNELYGDLETSGSDETYGNVESSGSDVMFTDNDIYGAGAEADGVEHACYTNEDEVQFVNNSIYE